MDCIWYSCCITDCGVSDSAEIYQKQTKGIADGKYMVVDCPEYPDAYIIVKNNSIQIYNIDVNAIYRNEQVESIKKICEDKESGIVLTGEEIEKLSDLNKMFVENAYKVDVEKGTKEGTYSYVYSCLSKGNYFGLHFCMILIIKQ